MFGAYQALSGRLGAVAAHCSRDGSGTGSHIGVDGVLESARQRFGRWYAGFVRGSDAEALDSLCKVVLIVPLGNDDLGGAGQRGCGGGARAAVMGGSGGRLARLLVDLADGRSRVRYPRVTVSRAGAIARRPAPDR